MIKWTVREIVKQEYVFEVEADTGEEALRMVEQGKGGKPKGTRELKSQYAAHPVGYPYSIPA